MKDINLYNMYYSLRINIVILSQFNTIITTRHPSGILDKFQGEGMNGDMCDIEYQHSSFVRCLSNINTPYLHRLYLLVTYEMIRY